MSIENTYAYNNANTCAIHSHATFAIDDECPICEQDTNIQEVNPYQEHIEHLGVIIRRQKAVNKRLEQDYQFLILSNAGLSHY